MTYVFRVRLFFFREVTGWFISWERVPGAADLITLRGAALLGTADLVIYAGSLVNPELLELCRADCQSYNSAGMTLEAGH